MKRFMLAVFAALSVFSVSASASTSDTFATVTTLDSGDVYQQTITGSGVSFSDYYAFDLASGGQYDFVAGVQDDYFSLRRISYDIQNLTLSLFSSSGSLVDGLDTFGLGDYFELSGLLDAGRYYLNVTGLTTGTSGGRYTVGFDAIAMPVPEPAEWILLLSGIGAVGMMIRRRQRTGRIAIAV